MARMGWNPLKEAEKAAKKAVDKVVKPAANAARNVVNKAGDEVRGGLRKVGREIEGSVKKVGNELESELKQAAHEVEDGFRKAAAEVQETFEERLPDLVEDAVEKLTSDAAKDAAKMALETACDVIETTAPDSYTLTLGIELALVVQAEVTVSLEIPNPVARLSKIRAWANKPPSGRAQIIECVKDFAPAALTVEAKVSGNGGSATYSGEHIYDGVDSFLAKHGVD